MHVLNFLSDEADTKITLPHLYCSDHSVAAIYILDPFAQPFQCSTKIAIDLELETPCQVAHLNVMYEENN